MKKTILSVLCGVVLGIFLMIGVFSILNLTSSNENILAQSIVDNNTESNQSEVVTEKEEEQEDGRLPMGVMLPIKDKVVEPESKSYYIKVNRQANCVTIYTQDEEGNYTVPVKAMTCSVGINNKTPLGMGKISDKYEWRLLFGNTYGHYSVRFNGHILFHSVPYLSKANDTLKEGQFNLLGEAASMGCVRLCVSDAKWIYDNCAKGIIVEVYDSPEPGPLGKPTLPKISEDSPYKNWDPTDPHPENPWQNDTMEN